VLISEGFWNRKFASALDVLGKGLNLEGRSYSIVGVVPANFNLQIGLFRASELYVPIGQWSNPAVHLRMAGLSIHGIGRLKPNVTIQQARSDMARVTGHLAEAYPEADKGLAQHSFHSRNKWWATCGDCCWCYSLPSDLFS